MTSGANKPSEKLTGVYRGMMLHSPELLASNCMQDFQIAKCHLYHVLQAVNALLALKWARKLNEVITVIQQRQTFFKKRIPHPNAF